MKVSSKISWRTVFYHLTEAQVVLDNLHCYYHFKAFGELPEERYDRDLKLFKSYVECREKRHRFTAMSLFYRLEDIYRHLNIAWNSRRMPEERVWKIDEKDSVRWSRFPRVKVFADLWTRDIPVVKNSGALAARNVTGSPVRLGLAMANTKLAGLCRLLADELGVDSPFKVPRKDKIGKEASRSALTEKEFARRLRRIYLYLNTAWNSRNDKTFVVTEKAVLRRMAFSPEFLIER